KHVLDKQIYNHKIRFNQHSSMRNFCANIIYACEFRISKIGITIKKKKLSQQVLKQKKKM
ncbi:unnamed protein product, partial [Arabidopsis halleri]